MEDKIKLQQPSLTYKQTLHTIDIRDENNNFCCNNNNNDNINIYINFFALNSTIFFNENVNYIK